MMRHDVVMTDGLGDGKGYEDILNHPHHVSTRRPHMSPEERAAQFSPFAALTGYGGVIQETTHQIEEQMEGEIVHERAEDLFWG